MLTSTAATGLPTRRFSGAILAGSWPQTDPATVHTVAGIHRQKALELLGHADDIRSTAIRLATTQSGATASAFSTSSHDLAGTITGHADRYFAMARASGEVSRILHGLRTDLDRLDAAAHVRIDEITRTATGPAALAAHARIIQTIANARADATAAATAAAEKITAQGAVLGGAAPLGGGKGGSAQPVDLRVPAPKDPAHLLSVHNAEDVHRVVDPLPPGRNRGVKVLPNAAAVEALYAELTQNGQPLPPGTYKGQWMVLPDGTRIGFRPDSKSGGPTVEIWNPDGSKMWDVHVGEPPKNWRPPVPAPAPEPVPVQVPEPAPGQAPVTVGAPAPDVGTAPALPPPSTVDIIIGGAIAVGAGIVLGIEQLGKWVFSP